MTGDIARKGDTAPMNGAALIVGYCTGMVFTRRIAPLDWAGTLALILPLTIWASGAALAFAALVLLVPPAGRLAVVAARAGEPAGAARDNQAGRDNHARGARHRHETPCRGQ